MAEIHEYLVPTQSAPATPEILSGWHVTQAAKRLQHQTIAEERILARGWEPWNKPKDMAIGLLDEFEALYPKKRFHDPWREREHYRWPVISPFLVFSGAIPPQIWEKARRDAPLFDRLMIASYDKTVFTPAATLYPKTDPLLIGWRDVPGMYKLYVGGAWGLETEVELAAAIYAA